MAWFCFIYSLQKVDPFLVESTPRRDRRRCRQEERERGREGDSVRKIGDTLERNWKESQERKKKKTGETGRGRRRPEEKQLPS